jgi:predicted nucleic acid-binding protein
MTAQHPAHEPSRVWLSRAAEGEIYGYISTHSLAELYGILTGYPKWRISPAMCLESINVLKGFLNVIPLSEADYSWTLHRLTELGIAGGGIYDALHARAALTAEVQALLTLNEQHFVRLGEDVARLVLRPDQH